MINIIFICLLIYYECCFCEETIKVKLGHIKGKTTNVRGKKVTAFLGIPYANQPLGRDRFRPPVEMTKDDWDEEPYEAFSRRNGCYQNTRKFILSGYNWTHPPIIAESCLHLNIWKPEKPNGAVFVFFYDILHLRGSATLEELNGRYLASKTNLIVVNLNYRMGIYGFGYLGEEGKYIPGNVALLDQQLGLKWIYENIESFGGDTRRITIAGFGSSGTLATAHLFSTKSEKYFKNIFTTSQSVTSVWAYNSRKTAEKITRKVAAKLNCINESDYEVFKCLSKANPYSLAVESEKLLQFGNNPFQYNFKIVENENVFFKGSLRRKIAMREMKRGFMLLGSRSLNIGGSYLTLFTDIFDYGCRTDANEYNSQNYSCKMNYKDFKIFIKIIDKTLKLKSYQLKKIVNSYTKKKKKQQNYFKIAKQIISDIFFNAEMEKFIYEMTIEKISKRAFFYEFSRISSADRKNYAEWLLPLPGTEIEYILGQPFTMPEKYNHRYLKLDQKVSLKMMDMVGNFVSTGRPGKKWKEFSSKKKRVVIVGDYNFCRDKPRQSSNVYSSKIKIINQYLRQCSKVKYCCE